MDYRICNVRIDLNACDCTWGCADTEEIIQVIHSSQRVKIQSGETPLE